MEKSQDRLDILKKIEEYERDVQLLFAINFVK